MRILKQLIIKIMNSIIKERPIPFSVDMVRALIQDFHSPGKYKNQTRRTRGLNRFNDFPKYLEEKGWEIQGFVEEEPGFWLAISNDEDGEFPKEFDPGIKCPYGKAGDHLWVQEIIWNDGDFGWFYNVGNDYLSGPYPEGWTEKVAHKIFVPAVNMPRWAARILLEITEIQVERLQDITWYDAQMEGIECIWHDPCTSVCLWKDYKGETIGFSSEKDSFFSLWEKIKGPNSVGRNPWVWVIKFKVLTIDGKLK